MYDARGVDSASRVAGRHLDLRPAMRARGASLGRRAVRGGFLQSFAYDATVKAHVNVSIRWTNGPWFHGSLLPRLGLLTALPLARWSIAPCDSPSYVFLALAPLRSLATAEECCAAQRTA